MPPVQPGSQLDDYTIDEFVASSITASIFRGRDLRTGRQVAIKIPHPDVESDVRFFDRFRREQDICERLSHPGVVKAFADEQRSRMYMVTEWVEGQLLRQI